MVIGHFGPLGSGKSYMMVYNAMMRVRVDKSEIFTNMQKLCIPQAALCDVPDELQLIIGGHDGSVVLSDETGLLMNARKWQSLPESAMDMLIQSRKRAVDFWYTCPDFAHVDTTIRTITHEAIICRPAGPYVLWRRVEPHEKKRLGLGLTRLRKEVFRLYDSWEEQKKRAGMYLGSAGHGPYRNLDDAKRRRGRERTRAALPPVPPLMRWNGRQREYTPEAAAAREWLLSHALLRRGDKHTQEYIEAELRRRQWLSLFDLTADNVPFECTPESPFQAYNGVDDRLERRAAREQEKHLEAAAKKGGSRARVLAS